MDKLWHERVDNSFGSAESTFPGTEKVAGDICRNAGLNEGEICKLMRGNAIRAFGLERFGITS